MGHLTARPLSGGEPAAGRAGSAVAGRLPWVAAAAVIAAQIPYPLLPAGGTGRACLTAAQILAFFTASVAHAALRRGWAFTAGYLALSLGVGFTVELVGLRTGWPFGHYAYTHRLGPEAGGAPLLIPLGWSMMSYPALLSGRYIAAQARAARDARRPGPPGAGQARADQSPAGSAAGRRRSAASPLTALAGGAVLAGWDLFLDPRMASEGFWVWHDGARHGGGWLSLGWLTGARLNGIPLTNTVGWLVVGTILVALLDRLPNPTRPHPARPGGRAVLPGWPADDAMPLLLLCWTYGSWVLACLVFFGQPVVALAGGLGMALPYLLALGVRSRRR